MKARKSGSVQRVRQSRSTGAGKTRIAAVPTPRLPRVPKGGRAQFFDDPAVDQLFAIVAALTAELSVVAERMRTLEAVLAAGGFIAPGAIETHAIEDADAVVRAQQREALIERVFQVLEAYGAVDE